MKLPLNLVVIAAGAGSRFAASSTVPKPLIKLWGHPFFWWATQSVLAQGDVESLTFVVLEEHIDLFSIDVAILALFPKARVLALPAVTAGAAATAMEAAKHIANGSPIGFLDCDLAFKASFLPKLLEDIIHYKLGGALCCFKSNSPSFSYIVTDGDCVIGTVEKKVVSEWAIAGLYLFKNASIFDLMYTKYMLMSAYDELFMSGMYNILCEYEKVFYGHLEEHISFGTPNELSLLQDNKTLELKWSHRYE